MVATRSAMIGAARAHLGYTEDPPGSNRTKFAEPAGHANGQPWCATFLVAVARSVGLQLPSESAWTPSMAEAFKPGSWHHTPKPGDLAFFNFGSGIIRHVGLVVGTPNHSVTCIEGNTSSSERGSQDNGGGVYTRTRPRAHVVGYGRPNYTTTPTPSEEDDMTELRYRWPDGSVVVVDPDGGVRCYGNPYYGSVPALDPQFTQAFSKAGAVTPVDPHDSSAGYVVWDQDADDRYEFNAGTLAAFGRR